MKNNERTYRTSEEIFEKISDKNLIEHPVVILGDGLNREAQLSNENDSNDYKGFTCWQSLLLKLADDLLGKGNEESDFLKYCFNNNTSAITYPELYDHILLAIESAQKASEKEIVNKCLQKKIMDEYPNNKKTFNNTTYQTFLNWCKHNNVPVLTTNYDLSIIDEELGRSENDMIYPKRLKGHAKKESRYYPLDRYFSPDELSLKDGLIDKFCVLPINGVVSIWESLRLNARDYMYYAARINNLIPHEYSDKAKPTNWVALFFYGNLIFAGKSLDTNESILRWLLIERKRFYVKNKVDIPKSYFIRYNGKETGQVQNNNAKFDPEQKYLEDLGLEFLDLDPENNLSDCFSFQNKLSGTRQFSSLK